MEKIHNLKVKQGLLISGVALGALLTTVSCFAKSKENNGGLIGENDSSSISSDLESSNLTTEKHTDLSSDETSISKSSEHRDSSSKDDDYAEDIYVTDDDYIQAVTTGPVFTTYEGTLATTTKSVKHSNVDGSSKTNENGSNSNSGTSVKQGGGGMHIASVDKNKTTKPSSTTVRLSTSTTKSTATTTKTTATTVKTTASTVSESSASDSHEMSSGTEFSESGGADIADVPQTNDIDPHDIRLACNNPEVFDVVSNDLRLKILQNCSVAPNTRVSIFIGYDTYMGAECRMILQMLNANNITNPDIYSYIFEDYSYEEMQRWENFAIYFKNILSDFECDINYNDFVANSEIANFMNEVHARRDDYNSLKAFIDDQIIEGHASQEVLESPQILPIVYSYYDGLDRGFIDNIYNSNLNFVYDASRSMTK